MLEQQTAVEAPIVEAPPVAPVVNTPTAANAGEYQVTFKRPDTFQMMASKFRLKVDGCMSFELRNGGEKTLYLKPGNHSAEVSVFGVPRKRKFEFQLLGEKTFLCKPNPAYAFTWVAVPVKVVDEAGKEY